MASKCYEACKIITGAVTVLFGMAAFILFVGFVVALTLPRVWVTVPREFFDLAAFFGKEGWRGS